MRQGKVLQITFCVVILFSCAFFTFLYKKKAFPEKSRKKTYLFHFICVMDLFVIAKCFFSDKPSARSRAILQR